MKIGSFAMPNNIGAIFVQLGQVLGICPCCGDIFRVSDTRPFMKNRPLRTPMDDIEAARERIERIEDSLYEKEDAFREKARAAGKKEAKKTA
jgi:hypothetical protein